MGDLEGERHVNRMLAFRCNVFGDAANESKHNCVVESIERVCGKIRNPVMLLLIAHNAPTDVLKMTE